MPLFVYIVLLSRVYHLVLHTSPVRHGENFIVECPTLKCSKFMIKFKFSFRNDLCAGGVARLRHSHKHKKVIIQYVFIAINENGGKQQFINKDCGCACDFSEGAIQRYYCDRNFHEFFSLSVCHFYLCRIYVMLHIKSGHVQQ